MTRNSFPGDGARCLDSGRVRQAFATGSMVRPHGVQAFYTPSFRI
jgi:hypothetical protein